MQRYPMTHYQPLQTGHASFMPNIVYIIALLMWSNIYVTIILFVGHWIKIMFNQLLFLESEELVSSTLRRYN